MLTKMINKTIKVVTIFTLLGLASNVYGAGVYLPVQGGTGISSVTAGDVGKFLMVSDDSPFTYTLTTASGGGGAGTFSTTTVFGTTQLQYPTVSNTVTSLDTNSTSTSKWSFNPITNVQYLSGKLGISSTTPFGMLSINPNGITGPALVIGSSTATNFVVTNGGKVGIGTLTPKAGLQIGSDFASQGASATGIDSNGPVYSNSGFYIPGLTELTATGLYDPNTFALKGYNGTARVDLIDFINNSSVNVGLNFPTGNIGIGTTSPYTKLSVVGETVAENFTSTSTTLANTLPRLISTNATTTNLATANIYATGSGGVQIKNSNGQNVLLLGAGSSQGATFSGGVTLSSLSDGCLYTSSNLITSTGSACGSGGGTGWASSTDPTSIYFTGSSNVGIGSTSPTYRLSVKGTGSGSSKSFVVTDVNNNITFSVNDNGDAQAGGRYMYPGTGSNVLVDAFSIYHTTGAALADSGLLYYSTGSTLADTSDNLYAPNMTTGSILFAGASGIISQDNASLFFDNTNNRLGLGTTSPYATLSVVGNIVATGSGTSTYAGPITSGTIAGRPILIQNAGAGGTPSTRCVIKIPGNITVTKVFALQTGATNVVGQLVKCDSSGLNPVVIDSSDITITSSEATDDGTLSSPTVTGGSYIGWKTTSVSGTNTNVTINYYYKDTQ